MILFGGKDSANCLEMIGSPNSLKYIKLKFDWVKIASISIFGLMNWGFHNRTRLSGKVSGILYMEESYEGIMNINT